ncbi:hypothetical protein ACFQT0_16040 [Hymenobacter humi]|uniref:Uncharacterized protein n=1 Tax=Hymenobacter humi TaxID=1411620 RepID=A0ABW2U5G2_9BACT
MPSTLEIEAQLVVHWNGHALQLAASGTYLILNIPSQQVLDELTAGPPKPPGTPKVPKPPGPDPMQQINDLAREPGLGARFAGGGQNLRHIWRTAHPQNHPERGAGKNWLLLSVGHPGCGGWRFKSVGAATNSPAIS